MKFVKTLFHLLVVGRILAVRITHKADESQNPSGTLQAQVGEGTPGPSAAPSPAAPAQGVAPGSPGNTSATTGTPDVHPVQQPTTTAGQTDQEKEEVKKEAKEVAPTKEVEAGTTKEGSVTQREVTQPSTGGTVGAGEPGAQAAASEPHSPAVDGAPITSPSGGTDNAAPQVQQHQEPVPQPAPSPAPKEPAPGVEASPKAVPGVQERKENVEQQLPDAKAATAQGPQNPAPAAGVEVPHPQPAVNQEPQNAGGPEAPKEVNAEDVAGKDAEPRPTKAEGEVHQQAGAGKAQFNAPEESSSGTQSTKKPSPATAESAAPKDAAKETKATEGEPKVVPPQSPTVSQPQNTSQQNGPASPPQPVTPQNATVSAPKNLTSVTNEKDVNAHHPAPQTPAADNAQTEVPTLETLVASGSICQKQEILSAYLEKEMDNGPMRAAFNPQKNPPPILERCRELRKRWPSVCHATNMTRQPMCNNVDIHRTIGRYFTYGVCTVEAALNQMYHKRYAGNLVANDMARYIQIVKRLVSASSEAYKNYGESLRILEGIHQLFLNAENALVSPEIQAVLYKRWDLMDTIFCGVAAGTQNDIVDRITADADRRTAQAIVDLEGYIASSTSVFMNAYKPLASLVAALEQKILKQATELNKKEFASKARDLVQNISDRHVASVTTDSLDSMTQMPHGGLNANELQRVTSMMTPSVSLVQRGFQVSGTSNKVDVMSPSDAVRMALLSINIFKVKGNHILPELDTELVKNMVREALLNLSDEQMVARLIVQPQAAIRVFYDTLISLIPLPGSGSRQGQENRIWLEQFSTIANVIEDNFNKARNRLTSPATGDDGRTSLLQVRDADTTSRFVVESRSGGFPVENHVSEYVDTMPFQRTMEPLAHVKIYSNVLFCYLTHISAVIGNLADDTDSVLFVNPKIIKRTPEGSPSESLADEDGYISASASRRSINEIISCIIAMLHGVEVFTSLPVLYLYKDDFKLGPALLIFILGLIRIPMNIKILFAFLSDGVPLWGSRRRSYLVIGSMLCLASNFILGFYAHLSLVWTTLLLAVSSLGMALCSVIGEALIIESGRRQTNDQVTRTISTFCAFRKLTFAAMSYLSSVLIMIMPKQQLFLMCSVIPLVVLISALFIREDEHYPQLSVKEQWSKLLSFIGKPEIKRPSTFLFISMLVPSAGTALFYFMTEELHFDPELFGRFAAIQAFASLIGVYCYAYIFRDCSIRKLYVWTTLFVSLCCMLSLVLVKRWNLALGIPDTAFVITDSSLLQLVGEINSLPIFIMATRLCPPGIESSMYSFLWTAQFLGLDISTYISSLLTYAFGIGARHFDGLINLIVFCAIAHMVPIFFVHLLPDRIPKTPVAEEAETVPCLQDGRFHYKKLNNKQGNAKIK
ncbi:integral membrane protein protein [Babesia ovis]|uniref:Integral membrane protein protein n=1 Tax=Babesia ovis TaxID=5869 RepID=A0A9W5TF23_BABOV|nr:integral membrane protein protein [Babesia ovis]